jgi:hypothetical protein
VTSLVIAAGGSGGAGGNVNYYFEPAAVLAFLVPLGLERLRRDWTPRSATATFMGLVVVVVLLPSLDVQRWKAFGAGPSGLQGAVAVVANKRILTDVPYLGARSVRPELLDPVSHVNLEESDSWQSDGLVKAVLAGDYDLVILHLSLDDLRWKSGRYITFSDSIRSAIARRYRFCFELDSLYVYGRAMDEETNGPSVECPAAPARAADPAAASDARPSPALSAAR